MNLSLIPVVKDHSQEQKIESVWEMSTYGATLTYLKKTCQSVYQSEFFPGVPSGQLVNGVLCQDVQNLSFADESLDLITSNQVFEHVANDLQGFAECHRVLRNGGALVLGVPLHDIPNTRQLAALIDGKLVFYGEPEYHGSRITGPRSVLTFWHYSMHDICERISSVGFEVQILKTTLSGSRVISSPVVFAVKH
jgi:SAM-dependent methyltransferase